MPHLLHPGFRSPVMRHRLVPFVSQHEVAFEIRVMECRLDTTIHAICALSSAEDIRAEHQVQLIDDEGLLRFECSLMLLHHRRLNVETRIDPPMLVPHRRNFAIKTSRPAMVWLFGVRDIEGGTL